MKSKRILILFLLATSVVACKKEKQAQPDPIKPTAENVEIGTANNKRGIIGRDFHFNADVFAGDKIATAGIRIVQKPSETYSAAWKLELTWNEFVGAKNTNIHKHFIIPTEAPKGKYEFIFFVKDQNGSILELKEDFTIITVEELPIDPKIELREAPTSNQVFKKGENIKVRIRVNDSKDLGNIYVLLIKDKLKHYPEHPAAIDYQKSAVIFMSREASLIKAATTMIEIGAEVDNKQPQGVTIADVKAWESGQYNIVVMYENITHDIKIFKSIPIQIDYR